MISKQKIIMMIPVCIFILGFISCQTVLKTALGLETPQMNVPNSVRLSYYQPFTEVNANSVKIYSVKDSTALKSAFEAFQITRM